MSKLTKLLREARGKEYFEIVAQIRKEQWSAIFSRLEILKEEKGKITPIVIGILCLEFDIPFKTMVEEFLEANHILPTGTYEYIKDSQNFKVRNLLEAARPYANIPPDSIEPKV